MSKKEILNKLEKSITELTEILPESTELNEMQEELTELNSEKIQKQSSHRKDGIVQSHIEEDKEANALTMQIKIDGTALKGQTAVQAFEAFSQMSVKDDKLLDNLVDIVQKNPPQVDEKIGQYFVRLADVDLIEIDDTIDHFINLFNA